MSYSFWSTRKFATLIQILFFANIFAVLGQPSPQSGVLTIWYSDETFSNLYSTKTNTAVDIMGKFFTGTGNFSGIFQGYISVTNTAIYEFQLEAAAHGELEFDGNIVGAPPETNFTIVPGSVLYMNNPTAFTNVVPAIHNAVEIYWTAETNKQYVVQWTSDLNTNWQTFGPVVFGNGNTNSAFDSTRFSEKRFYRVIGW